MQALSYAELLGMEGDALHIEMLSASGEVFIVETQVDWDDRKRETLRVMVDVWRPATRGLIVGSEAADDFIRTPDSE